ncbi:hypothetical protein NQ317_019426 [Molorchus minor]|uniref:Pickpocket protein 28-like n=1 Tax=Molorchus minor TaxID=1323400 RepID=A0ABQ9IZV7_9CUCU|nr:hypothetical protein NQ317_019426 [Molorchus minor]
MDGSYFKRHKGRHLRKYFKEYCENTTIHGFRYLAEKRSIVEKIFWIILILSSIGVCSYLINRIYEKYRTSPVIVSFATKESPIFTIPFPAVTICPVTKASSLMINFTEVYYKKVDNETVDPIEYVTKELLSF